MPTTALADDSVVGHFPLQNASFIAPGWTLLMWRLSEQAQALLQQLHDLLSSAAWFRKAKREEGILAVLDQIKRQGEPAAVCSVALCLFESSQQIKTVASRTIHYLLSLVSPDQLIHLSGVVGWSWGWYIWDAWDKLAPKSLSTLLVDLESQAAVLGLLSFHRNGYVRHEAVRLLAREKTGDELRYLLIRQNDWVGVIGDDAQTAVNRRLVPSYLPHFVRCLPLVVHLLDFRRRDLAPVVHKVVDMLVQPQHDAMLTEIIKSPEPSVRRQVVRAALEMAGGHQARVIHHGLSSTDAIIRLMCATRVGQSLSGPELQQTTMLLQRDRFMPVRREGFRVEAEGSPDEAANVWERALLDSHASIRELARYSLGKMRTLDAAAFYRQALAENSISLPAVSGLAECGDQEDLLRLRSVLAHPQPRFRCVAIRGIARIAREGAVDDLLRSLRDSSPSVVREAKRQLESFLGDVSGESLFAILTEAHSENTRRCAVQLIFDKGKWQSLPWLIRIAFRGDQEMALVARRFIEAWFSPPLCNKVFTKPSAIERQAIDEALHSLRPSQDDLFLARVQEWLRQV
jgi:HEAT repeat protein